MASSGSEPAASAPDLDARRRPSGHSSDGGSPRRWPAGDQAPDREDRRGLARRVAREFRQRGRLREAGGCGIRHVHIRFLGFAQGSDPDPSRALELRPGHGRSSRDPRVRRLPAHRLVRILLVRAAAARSPDPRRSLRHGLGGTARRPGASVPRSPAVARDHPRSRSILLASRAGRPRPARRGAARGPPGKFASSDSLCERAAHLRARTPTDGGVRPGSDDEHVRADRDHGNRHGPRIADSSGWRGSGVPGSADCQCSNLCSRPEPEARSRGHGR